MKGGMNLTALDAGMEDDLPDERTNVAEASSRVPGSCGVLVNAATLRL
jgi:hypothetical protein